MKTWILAAVLGLSCLAVWGCGEAGGEAAEEAPTTREEAEAEGSD